MPWLPAISDAGSTAGAGPQNTVASGNCRPLNESVSTGECTVPSSSDDGHQHRIDVTHAGHPRRDGFDVLCANGDAERPAGALLDSAGFGKSAVQR